MTLAEIKKECSFMSISEYIVDSVIPNSIDDYGYIIDMTNKWVLIVTNFVTFRAKRKYITAYTENDNDCLCIKTGKGVYQLILVDNIIAVEYETADDIDV